MILKIINSTSQRACDLIDWKSLLTLDQTGRSDGGALLHRPEQSIGHQTEIECSQNRQDQGNGRSLEEDIKVLVLEQERQKRIAAEKVKLL